MTEPNQNRGQVTGVPFASKIELSNQREIRQVTNDANDGLNWIGLDWIG